MTIIYTALANPVLYEENILLNNYLPNESFHKAPVRIPAGQSQTVIFNRKLEEITDDMHCWVLFCSNTTSINGDLNSYLESADTSSLYGFLGYRKILLRNDTERHECLGRASLFPPQNANIFQSYTCFAGIDCRAGTEVDALGGGALLIHTDLIRKTSLRFNTQLNDTFFIELFSQQAHQEGIPCRILPLECSYDPSELPRKLSQTSKSYERRWEHLYDKCLKARSSYAKDQASYRKLCRSLGFFAYPNDECNIVFPVERLYRAPSNIYKQQEGQVSLTGHLASSFIKGKAKILDMGCAQGDVSSYMKKVLPEASFLGMEYSSTSIFEARKKNIFEDVIQADFNQLYLPEYTQYYSFFDNILLLDVLEHLRNPLGLLQKVSSLLDPHGSIIVSLPNIACFHISAQLLQQNFDYENSGILDETHLRFYTAKSMAELFARAGLLVQGAKATFCNTRVNIAYLTKDFPAYYYEMLMKNKHFSVLQYVSSLTPSEAEYSDLVEHNLAILNESPEKEINQWHACYPEIALSLEALYVSRGKPYPPVQHKKIISELDQNLDKALIESFLFSPLWYIKTYPEILAENNSPVRHYYEKGWKEGKDPRPLFSTTHYIDTILGGKADECPLVHYLRKGHSEGKPLVDSVTSTLSGKERLAVEYIDKLFTEANNKSLYVEKAEKPYTPAEETPKLIAFYLPQFYPTYENDAWWGKGFTEWTNVTRALPQYPGHYQPRLPADFGFYDLRLEDIAKKQMDLAKHYGIHGFCYYHYWFGRRKKMLGMSAARHLANPALDMPFCLAWANERWSALWDGGNKEILVDQPQEINVQALFDEFFPYWKDSRYITVNGKPFFIIYYPLHYTNKDAFINNIEELQLLAKKNGLPGLHIAFVRTNMKIQSPEEYGGDAIVQFPPLHGRFLPIVASSPNPFLDGALCDFKALAESYMEQTIPSGILYRGVAPMWDNSPRKVSSGCTIFKGYSPEFYETWLLDALEKTKAHNPKGSELVFINAWNEWGEGAYLEPDQRYGFAYLEATKQALIRSCTKGK